MSKTFADFMYTGEELFLKQVAKRINSLARGHGKARVLRQGKTPPFLTYEGQDMNDFDIEMTFGLISTSGSDVLVHYFGKGSYNGVFQGKAPLKWGQLKPEFLVSQWKERVSLY